MKRCLELTLLLGGILLLGAASFKALRYEAFQHHPGWFTAATRQLQPQETDRSSPQTQGIAHTSRILGRLEIPRLRLAVPILEGDDEDSLELTAGHVPGTAAIGTPGNVVIAGHRDTTFRALRRIRLGDQIRLESNHTYMYLVDVIQIVEPDDVRVLQSTSDSTLTLITCYPFRFVGSAPKRYVIRAKKLPA